MIILAAAMGEHNELGKNGAPPLWNLPDEYNTFRKSIHYHPIIIGRKSFEAMKQPIKDSLNIVVTRNQNYHAKGAVVAHSLQEAINLAKTKDKNVYIVGGGGVFEEAIQIADCLEISRIEAYFPDADAFFPEFSINEWQLVKESFHEIDEDHAYRFSFQVWIRKKL